MQWLIDTIKDWVNAQGFLKTSFVDRGDPDLPDYLTGHFTKDNAWYDLDLSAIVPENVKSIALSVIIVATDANNKIEFRKKGNIEVANTSQQWTAVAFEFFTTDMIVACDENRVIQYRATIDNWPVLDVIVKGWWL